MANEKRRKNDNKDTIFSSSGTGLKKSIDFKQIENPYIAGMPLRGDNPLFFGRENAFHFIDKNILVSGASKTIVCYGLRRTGKTSFLNLIERQGFTDKRLVPIIIDMQGIDDEKDFYHSLSIAIVEKLSLTSTLATPAVANFSQFKQFLEKIKPGLGEKMVVIMLDEFECIQSLVEAKRISRIIFNNLRYLMQHEKKLAFLFCGTHKFEDMSADYWSIFLNTAIYFTISPLESKDAIRLIREPVKAQLTYDDLAVEQILKMSGRQPYLIQLICRTLVNDLNENKKKNEVLIDDVNDTVKEIITYRTEPFSQHIWYESDLVELLVLSSTAGELDDTKQEYIGFDAIYKNIKSITGKFSGKEVQKALEKLVSRDILLEKDMRYGFQVNLLKEWISGHYPLQKMKKEL